MQFCEKFLNNKYVVRYRTDYEYRTILTTVLSSVTTSAVATYHLALALLTVSSGVWFYTIAAYYYSLALIRLLVLASHRFGIWRREDKLTRQRRDARNYLAGGALLVPLTLTYSGIVVLVAVKNFHFDYRGHMIYVMALYAFYKIVSSVVKVIKYKKYRDFTIQTFRNINLADGIVSVIALQSALLFTFSSAEDAAFAYYMNAAIGGVAGLLLLMLGSYMIVRGYHRIQELKERQEPDE